MIGFFIVLIIMAIITIVVTIAILRNKVSDEVAIVLYLTMTWFWMLMTFTICYENYKNTSTTKEIYQVKTELKDSVQTVK